MQKLGGKVIRAYCDSRLIVGQVRGDFKAKDPRMLWYLNQVKHLSGAFILLRLHKFLEVKILTLIH